MVTMILNTSKMLIYHLFSIKMHFKSIVRICFDSLGRAGPSPYLGKTVEQALVVWVQVSQTRGLKAGELTQLLAAF